MKTWIVLLAWITLAAMAVAQETGTGRSNPGKIISIVGRASNDGQLLVGDTDAKVWTVENPEVLRGHEAARVVARGRAEGHQNKIFLISVKPKKDELEYSARWGDSAFRR